MNFILKNKYTISIFLVLIVGVFLRIDRIETFMPFLGEQALFYISARDMILTGEIPLIGHPTSHPWIFHGPIWIYILGIIFLITDFSPVAPAYFIAILGTMSILIFYYVVKTIFDQKIAILSAILFSTSPLIVLNSRFVHHTSPISFLVILLYFFTFQLTKGIAWSLPVITFLLGMLYNHEITTFVYFGVIFIILLYGFYKKEKWFKKLINIRLILASIISFLIPMLPFIIHDLSNGQFNQTLRFLVWVVYRFVKIPLSLIDERFTSNVSSTSTLPDVFSYFKLLFFALNDLIAIIILLLVVSYSLNYFYRNIKVKYKYKNAIKSSVDIQHAILFLFLLISLVGLSIHRVPIAADMLLVAIFLILLLVLSINWITKNNFKISLIIVIFISILNINYLLSTDYRTNLLGSSSITFQERLISIEEINQLSTNKKYNLVGKGSFSSESFFYKNYEFLLWKAGNPISKEEVDFKILVWEKDGEIIVQELNED